MIGNRNIELLHETMEIINAGGYEQQGQKSLKLTKEQMCEAIVLTDEQVGWLIANPLDFYITDIGSCCFSVSNIDSFASAINLSKDFLFQGDEEEGKKVLVLNFANPLEPGGGVYRGATAQEEDLCRKSTLLLSLESEEAKEYYQAHGNMSSYLFSDAMILSPNVEIFRDERNDLLEDSVVVSVLTCGAPYAKGLRDVSNEELEKVIYHRILGMLMVAAKYGYQHLVLGAWGCGAFGNDPEMVSRLFYKAFKEVRWETTGGYIYADSLFRQVVFAILSRDEQQNNLNCFKTYFDDFYHDEEEVTL